MFSKKQEGKILMTFSFPAGVDQFYKDVLNVAAAFNQSQAGGGSTEYHVPNDQVLILKRYNGFVV